ncbi:MAG: Unknown protein [uncultured Sulfurovum sp.]|uniref:Uncharacterized protein n=1 Tax=uncultured Sulfurovum sp. TaxID=269237 RepID=A0A6S6RWN7_9BACT|nr:MAG: Unknown protein [uncultured Sulfurovum sp.]
MLFSFLFISCNDNILSFDKGTSTKDLNKKNIRIHTLNIEHNSITHQNNAINTNLNGMIVIEK